MGKFRFAKREASLEASDEFSLIEDKKDRFHFAKVKESPGRAFMQRVFIALSLIFFAAFISYLGRKGYVDNGQEGIIDFWDALYYATVSVTTTGYGDIIPVSEEARLVTTLIITPLRVLFLIVLVGTTVEVLASHSRFLHKVSKWQDKISDHTVICGFGTKGQAAYEHLIQANQCQKDNVVVIDPSLDAEETANSLGLVSIRGEATDGDILKEARVDRAKTVIVAVSRDNDSVLTTLRARELNPSCFITSSCRESKNKSLLENSGADNVTLSSEAAGRMIGLSAYAKNSTRVVNDLLNSGGGLDIKERKVSAQEVGLKIGRKETYLMVERDGKLISFASPQLGELKENDRVIYIKDNED